MAKSYTMGGSVEVTIGRGLYEERSGMRLKPKGSALTWTVTGNWCVIKNCTETIIRRDLRLYNRRAKQIWIMLIIGTG